MRDRRFAWLSGLLVGLSAPGCLGAPPAEEGGPDAVEVDAAIGGQTDASGGCQAIVRDHFDDPGHWVPVAPPGTAVDSQPTWVRVVATPSESVFVYGDLHTERQEPIEGTTLTVAVEGPIVSVVGQVGISWQTGDGDDYYRLVVSGGNLRALHKPSALAEAEVCTSPCPSYSRFDHARLQLREEGGVVFFESAANGGPWEEIGTAPRSAFTYRVVLFAEATGPGSGDLNVTGADWGACGE